MQEVLFTYHQRLDQPPPPPSQQSHLHASTPTPTPLSNMKRNNQVKVMIHLKIEVVNREKSIYSKFVTATTVALIVHLFEIKFE